MKIKFEQLKKRLIETEKMSLETLGASESNEKELKLFQYKYARLTRVSREFELSKQHEIETLKASIKEFEKQLQNIQKSSAVESSSIRNDLRDILYVLHSVTSQIVDQGTTESRLAGEMLHGVIERVNSIMSNNDDYDCISKNDRLLDNVTASMVKMCQDMEKDSAEKQKVITNLQHALENTNSTNSTKMLMNQYNEIMKRSTKRSGISKKKTAMRRSVNTTKSSRVIEEDKDKKRKKKKKKKMKKIPKPPSNTERRARIRREEALLRNVRSNHAREKQQQKENSVRINRKRNISISPSRRKMNHSSSRVEKKPQISDRVATRLEQWLSSHVLSDDEESNNQIEPILPQPMRLSNRINDETKMVYSSSSDEDDKKAVVSLSSRRRNQDKCSNEKIKSVEKVVKKEEEEDTVLQQEISILDREIRDLKESLESATLALGV